MKKLVEQMSEIAAKEFVFSKKVFDEVYKKLPSHLVASESIIKQNLVIETIATIGDSTMELFLHKDDAKYHIGYLKVYDDGSIEYDEYNADIPIGN